MEFVSRTGCDSLAVAIGTSHGAYKFKGEAKLDFDRLARIGEKLPNYPLVLHGASSVPQEFVSLCNQFGGQVGGAKGVPEDMVASVPELTMAQASFLPPATGSTRPPSPASSPAKPALKTTEPLCRQACAQ